MADYSKPIDQPGGMAIHELAGNMLEAGRNASHMRIPIIDFGGKPWVMELTAIMYPLDGACAVNDDWIRVINLLRDATEEATP